MYSYNVAETDDDIETILRLIKRVYTKSGYVSDDSKESKFRPYILSSGTGIFKGSYNETTFATISIIKDSSIGLPMDDLYQEELSIFRKEGKKIAEVSQFAVDTDLLKMLDTGFSLTKQLSVSHNLFSLVLNHATENDLDYLCIAINPKHDFFYKTLGFEEIGGLKYYASVNNAPALARALNLKKSNPSLWLKGLGYAKKTFS